MPAILPLPTDSDPHPGRATAPIACQLFYFASVSRVVSNRGGVRLARLNPDIFTRLCRRGSLELSAGLQAHAWQKPEVFTCPGRASGAYYTASPGAITVVVCLYGWLIGSHAQSLALTFPFSSAQQRMLLPRQAQFPRALPRGPRKNIGRAG